jgi:hypothetical protein
MSGGAFNYAYNRVDEFASELKLRLEQRNESDGYGGHPNQVNDEVFSALTRLQAMAEVMAKLMREAEWLYSGDTGDDSFLRRVREITEATGLDE